MACAAEHAQFNFFAVMATSAVVKSRNGEPIDGVPVAMGAAAALMPSLPDLFEPAVHPNHRKLFHSVAMAIAISCGMYRAYKWETQGDWERLARALLLVGGAAYLGHLARDAFTAKSLPLV
jgi:inner membrane protein